ncbi:MAG: hypothetical protein AAF862_06610 [Pseudomonadota bacterium]
MQHKSNTASDGYTLLSVLWIVLLLGILASSISLIGISSRKQAAGFTNKSKADAAIDAAFNGIVYDLLTQQQKSRWSPTRGPVIRQYMWQDVAMRIEVSNDHGKVDINRASDEVLETLFIGAGLSASTTSRLILQLRDAQRSLPGPKRFGVIDELLSVPGMTPSLLNCLRPHITLYTWRSKPNLTVADPAIKRTFGGRSTSPSNLRPTAANTTGAQVLTLKITVQDPSGVADRYIRIRLTGNKAKPLWIYAWHRRYSQVTSSYPSCKV